MDNTIKKLSEQIYSQISKRVLHRKKKAKKQRFKITDANNVQLLSNIMHNKRVKNRNPYLLNDKITYDIVTNLNFSSAYELIWGSEDELSSNLDAILETGINILMDTQVALIDNCLYEYLPYCKAAAQYENAIDPMKPEIETMGELQRQAIMYLVYHLHSEASKMHFEFFKDKGTKKLDKNLTIFIQDYLPKLLEHLLNDTNYNGKRVYDLISSIVNYEKENLYEDISHGPEWFAHQPLSNSERPMMDVRNDVIEAGDKYIDTIIDERKEIDPFFMDYPFFM